MTDIKNLTIFFSIFLGFSQFFMDTSDEAITEKLPDMLFTAHSVKIAEFYCPSDFT